MRINFVLVILFVLTLVVTVIAVFYRDRFLVFVHGYEQDVLHSNHPQSFEAYRDIYKAKIVFLVLGWLLSAATWFLLRKYMMQHNSSVYRLMQWASLVSVVIFTISIVLYYLLPKRLL